MIGVQSAQMTVSVICCEGFLRAGAGVGTVAGAGVVAVAGLGAVAALAGLRGTQPPSCILAFE